jgi:hypothetical protein
VAGEPPLDKDEDERSRLARRQLLQKHLPADEETLKLHLERLIFVSGRIRSKKARRMEFRFTCRGDCAPVSHHLTPVHSP